MGVEPAHDESLPGLVARVAGALLLALGAGAGAVIVMAPDLFAGAAPEPVVAVRAGALLAMAIALVAALPAFLLAGGGRFVRRHRGRTGDGRIDRLTGLSNERELRDELERATALATRSERPVALAVLDIDDFELFNHTHGSDHGDRVLRTLAEILMEEARPYDRCFRTGGDDFAVLLTDTDLVGAVAAMERVVARLDERRLGLRIAVGLAAARGEGQDPAALAEAAREALAAARARGDALGTAPERGLGPAPTAVARRRALQELLTDGGIGIEFQPILDLCGSLPLGYEALARPHAPAFDGPGDVFEMAERLGRGHELDTLCRRAAVAASRDLPAWALMFLNVSPQSFQRRTLLPEQLAEAVRFAGREPESVVLEITERATVPLATVAAEARALADQGFRIALDDTGAGNAGLGMLRALPLDFVKIDRLVLQQAQRSRSARAVLAAILAFAEHRGVDVIAEGIEDADTLAFVRALPAGAVRGVQGYHLGRPSRTICALPRPAQVDPPLHR